MIFLNAVLEKHQSDVCSVNINVRVFVRVELLTAVEEFMCKRLPLTNSSIIMQNIVYYMNVAHAACVLRSAVGGCVCVRVCVQTVQCVTRVPEAWLVYVMKTVESCVYINIYFACLVVCD